MINPIVPSLRNKQKNKSRRIPVNNGKGILIINKRLQTSLK
jgi:hypothetical protein